MRNNRSRLVRVAEVGGKLLLAVIVFLIIVGTALVQSDMGVCDTPFGARDVRCIGHYR
jgi:hypothetical protein